MINSLIILPLFSVQQLQPAGDPPRAAVQLLLRLLSDGVVPRVRRPGRTLLQEHQRLPQGAGGRAGIKTSMDEAELEISFGYIRPLKALKLIGLSYLSVSNRHCLDWLRSMSLAWVNGTQTGIIVRYHLTYLSHM